MTTTTDVRERPIIMSTPLVPPTMDGTKTQTRSVVKRPPWYDGCAQCWHIATPHNHSDLHGVDGQPNAAGVVFGTTPYLRVPACDHKAVGGGRLRCPYGKPGDRLYVRETFSYAARRSLYPGVVFFRADGDDQPGKQVPLSYIDRERHWRPSIHMPKWATRIWLELTDVRVERVQDITADDIEAEGVYCVMHSTDDEADTRLNVGRFRDLWNRLNAKRGHPWDANDWVWALTFRVSEVGR